MNRIYRTLWSAATQSWQAVPETAKTAGKKSKSSAGGVVASVALSFSLSGGVGAQSPPAINQLPTGGTVARGTATISQTVTAQAAAMVVNQSSQRAVINWNTFNLGSAASINFVQPNAQSVTLNRVNDSNPSQIFGRITANGQVFLTNASGVYFSRSSSVDVGAITATTHSISDDNFMSGKYVFERNGATGKVINEGNITAALGGYVALLAPEVQNAGVVVARAGTVAMAAGELITLNIDGAGSLAGITTTPSAIASLVENKLAVLAPDGQIILSAVAMDKLQAGVVKNSGSLEANSLVNKGGKILLEGDDIVMDRNSRIEAKGRTGGGVVLVGGDWQGSGDVRQATKVTMEAGATIDASATDNGDGGKVVLWSDIHNANSVTQVNGSIYAKAGPNGGDGGQVETSGHQVDIAGALVNAGADQGQGGSWLLDPYDYTIGATEVTTIQGSLNTGTSFTVDTTNATSGNSTTIAGSSGTGTITVSSAISKTAGAATTLTLNAANNIVINAGISSTYNSLSLNMTAGGSISGTGNLALNGGTATFNQATDGTYSGFLAGTNTSLTKLGAGTLTLSGTGMTYTGATTISAGAIKAGTATPFSTSAVTVNSGAALDLNGQSFSTNTGNLTINGSGINGGGALINSSATSASYGNLVKLGSNATVTADMGTISLYYSSAITGATYALTLDGATGGSISSPIGTTTGSLIKQGAGTWTLSGTSTYTGGTTISAGTLKAGNVKAFGTTGDITVNSGAVLDLNGYNMTSTGGLTLNGTGINNGGALINSTTTAATYAGLVTLGSDTLIKSGTGTGTIKLSNAGSISGAYGLTLDGAAGGTITSALGTSTGTLTKQGTGTWTLTGANSYSGTTTISAGTLQFGNGTVTTTAMGTGPIVNNATLAINAAVGLTFAPNTISGTGALTVSGATADSGMVTLKADNTFSGGITLYSGPRLIAGGSSTGSPGALTASPLGTGTLTMNTNSRFDLAGYQIGNTLKTNANVTAPVIYANSGGVSELTGQVDATLAGSSFILSPSLGNTLKLTGTLNNAVISSPIQYVINQSGAGDVLTQFSAITNDYYFQLNATAGKWTIGNSLTGSKAGVVVSGGILDLAGYDIARSGTNLNTTLSGGTLTNSASTTSSIRGGSFYLGASSTVNTPSGTIDASVNGGVYGTYATGFTLTKTGTGDFHFKGTIISASTGSPYDFNTNVTAGNIWYEATGTGAFGSNFSIATGSTMYMNAAATVAGAISGGGSVVVRANNTFSGANTYTGGTTVFNGATLTLGRAAVMSGSTITSSAIGTGALTLGDATTAGTLNMGGYALLPNNIVLNGTATISSGTAAAAQVVSGTISDGSNTGKGLTLWASSTGTGKTLEISGNNSYTGTTTIASSTGDSVIMSNSNALGVGSAGILYSSNLTADTLMLKGGITLSKSITMASGQSGTFGGLSGDNTFTGNLTRSSSFSNLTTTISNAAGTLTFSPASGNAIDYGSTVAAPLIFSGAGNIVVNGPVVGSGAITSSAGLLTLAGNNTFTGALTVSSGAVRAASNTALGATTGATTVNTGAALELGGPASPSGIAIGAEGLTVATGGLVHNVAGYNTYAGAMTLSGNATITVDTGTRLNFTATGAGITVNNPSLLTLYTNGDLTFGKPLIGTGSYVKVGSGTLSLATGTTLAGKTGIFAGLYDPSGTDYSSEYGSGPDLTFAFFDSASGGNKITMVSGTDYSGTVSWTGTVPTSTSNAGTYALTYASGLTVTKAGYVLLGATSATNWTVAPKAVTVSLNAPSSTYTYNGSTTYASIASGLTAFSTSSMLGSDNVASITSTTLATGVAQAGSFTITPSNAVMGTGLASNYSFTYSPLVVSIARASLTLAATTDSKTYDGTTASSAAVTITGKAASDTVVASQAFASKNAVGTGNSTLQVNTGYTITDASNHDMSSNYDVTTVSATGTISKASLTLTAATDSKTYDGTTTSVGVVGVSGNVASDTVVATQVFASKNALGTGNSTLQVNTGYTIKDALNADMSGNYTITTATATGTINKATLSLIATSDSKTYDGTTNSTVGVSVTGKAAPDTVVATQAFADKNVLGTGNSILQIAPGYTIKDANNADMSGNYVVNVSATAAGTISPATASIAAAKTYDGVATLAAPQITISGVNGETLSYTGTALLQSANVRDNASNYVSGLTALADNGSALAANYVLPSQTAASARNTVTISKASATVTAGSSTTTYSGVAQTISGFTATGLVNGETEAVLTGVTSSATGTNAGTYTSTASGTDGNYNLTFVNGALTINKANATVTAGSSTTTYTGLAQSVSGFTATGLVNGETTSVLTGVTTSGGTGTNAGTYASTASGTATNYNLTFVDGALTINKAHLTVTANNASKTYGDNNPALSTTVTGFVNGETTAVLTGSGSATTTATATTGAGTATITAGAGTLSASNYDFTNLVDGTLTINKAHLTVTANNASKTYGDTNPTLSATVSGFVNNETLGTSGVTGSGAASTTATALTGAGTASITAGVGTLAAANYDFTNLVNGTLTINKANATVTANSGTATYTGLAQSVSGFTASGLVNGESASVLTGVTASGTGTNAGTYASTASGTDTNYNLTFVPGSFTINKAHLTVTANNASKTYGDNNPALSITVSGFVNGETLGTSGVTGAGAASTTATALTGAGTATITSSLGTLTASNYDFTNFVNGTLTINKANATVTARSGTATYTGLAQSVSGFTATGLVNNESATVLTGVSTSGGTGTNAGTYTHTASGTDSNYNLTFVNGALTINKANATVTANSGSTTYNGAVQSISGFTATGLVNNETPAVLTGVSTGASGTNAGTYTHTASGTDGNYNLTFVDGTFTINKAPLSVSLSGQTKVYDGTTSATLANGSLTLTGFVSGEGATVSQTQASYNSANVVGATTVTASLAAGNYTASTGTLLSNYVLPTSATGTGSITPARLSASGTKTYDGLVSFDATGLTVSGVNGETFTATGSGTMSSKNVQTNQAMSSIAGLSLSGNNGALASNYFALATSDTQVSVTPLAVNLSAPAASKTYDSTTLYQVSTSDLSALSSQLVGNDRVTAADVVYANKDAGTGKRVSLNSVTISDDNGGNNYTVGKLDVNTGVISKAQLTVSVVSDARFVTQSDAAGYAGVVYNGFVGGETASVVTAGSITRNNANTDTGARQYTGVLQASGWQSNNYNISYVAGDYTIVGAHTLLVSVPTAATTYGTAATYTPTAKYLDSSNNTIVTLTPTMTGNVLSVSDNAGGSASFSISAANATLSSSGNVQAGGYNLQPTNVVKTGDNFQNLVMTGGLTVNPKVLSNNLGVQSISKVYDGSASISNFGLSFNQALAGVTTGDTVSLVGSGSFDDRHVGTNKTVNLSLGLRGTDAANYALTNSSLSTSVGEITQLASVTYTGATNGNWSDFSNWAGGAMPDRNNVAQVIVPAGKTVLYNSDQLGTIGSTLTVDGAVRFTSSNPFTLVNTVSGSGDLQQRGNGMLTISGINTNFSGNLDIGSYQATLDNAQALGTGHVASSGGQLSVTSGMTLSALQIDGAVTVDTAIKTTGNQVYNGALTFLSTGTAQAPNFVSDTGNVNFMGTVSAGSGSMTAQRSLAVSAPQGSVLFNDQVGRLVKNLDFSTYLTSGLLDTSPYALTVTAPTIKLFGDVTTFDSQTYDGAVRVGNNTLNSYTRLLVSVDPSITFKSTVDDASPAGKVNGLDVRAISLAAITGNTPVPKITFDGNVGSTSPLASLRLAVGTQSTAAGAMVTDIKTDTASRTDPNYKGIIELKGNLTVDAAPEMIAGELSTPNGSPTLTWHSGTPNFKFRLYGNSNQFDHLQYGQNTGGNGNGNGSSNGAGSGSNLPSDITEAGRQWLMAHDTHEHTMQVRANEAAMKAMDTPTGRMVADVQVGNEATSLPTMAKGASPRVEAQTVNVSSTGAFVQVREFAPQTLPTQQAFVYEMPADTFVHSRETEFIKLSATLSNGANLPRWVKFSPKTRTFSGEAPKHIKSLDVKVIATDRQGNKAMTRVRLLFTNGSNS